MAVEMVYIPEVAFYAGSGGSEDGHFHVGNDVNTPYLITSEGQITIGTGVGELYYLSGTYSGDQTGPIPAAFPKGYAAFYCMKYEITQEQYKEFLNCLDRTQQNSRTYTDISGTSTSNVFVLTNTSTITYRNNIKCDASFPATGAITFYNDLDNDGIYDEANDGQGVAAYNINPDDLLAYLDWSGLRPMTDLEYEKACRGTATSVADEYAWLLKLLH